MSKELLMYLIYAITFFPCTIILVICIFRHKDDKLKRKKYASILALFYIIYFSIPMERIIDNLPLKLSEIETAFKFDYNDLFNREKYKLIYKEKYKNTYFVIGRKDTAPGLATLEEFNCYYKNKENWRPVLTPFKYNIDYGDNSGYNIYYCNNTKENITGIFVTTIPLAPSLKEDLEITDKYQTEFKYIVDENNKPIKYASKNNKIYFGVINHNINDEYYLKINNKKVKIKEN